MSRWIFTEDGSAIQASHIVRLAIGKSGITFQPFCVLAHLVTGHIIQITGYDSRTEAEEAVKDLIVGREHKREL